jgi:hypothetical protein
MDDPVDLPLIQLDHGAVWANGDAVLLNYRFDNLKSVGVDFDVVLGPADWISYDTLEAEVCGDLSSNECNSSIRKVEASGTESVAWLYLRAIVGRSLFLLKRLIRSLSSEFLLDTQTE